MGVMMYEALGQRDLEPHVTWIPLAGYTRDDHEIA